MRTVFIGSSSEALPQARRVAETLKGIDGLETLLWNQLDVFQPGALTFEAIEDVSEQIAGAILLATPDDPARIRASDVMVPRANVMLEWGFFAGRGDRRNIALLRYDGVTLPTDLSSLTYIPMGPFAIAQAELAPPLSTELSETLITWASRLPRRALGLATAEKLHPYSGRWTIILSFERWRKLDIVRPNEVRVHAQMYLWIPQSGHGGNGVIFGRLTVELDGAYREFKVVDEIESVAVDSNGDISFRSRTFSRERIDLATDDRSGDGLRQTLMGVAEYDWTLAPTTTARTFSGVYRTLDTGPQFRSLATISAKHTG